MNRRKFSPQFERDYAFYLKHKDRFTFAGTDIKKDYGIQFPGEPEVIIKDEDGNDEVVPFNFPYSEAGKNAKNCFHLLDSSGKSSPCSEPELLVQILNCKAALNLQIKIWAQSRAEYTLPLFELQEYMEHYQCPDWVIKAVENQKAKILKEWNAEQKWKQHGFYYEAAVFNFIEILAFQKD